MCVLEACVEGFALSDQGHCVEEIECPPGYLVEGGMCFPTNVPCDPAIHPLCPHACCDDCTGVSCNECIDCTTPPEPNSCINGCHNGIEDPHPWLGGPQLTCTGCHGGDAEATDRVQAHVPLPALWQEGAPQWGRPNLRYYFNYLTLTGVERFEGGLQWLRFRNPGDLRVADQTCGAESGCHQARVENVRRSLMATASGLLGGALAASGVGRASPRTGDGVYSWDATVGFGYEVLSSTNHHPEEVGSVAQLQPLQVVDRASAPYDELQLLRDVYDKACGGCHLGSAGENRRYGDFRSSGCSACHMRYALDGRSRSLDPMISKAEPTFPQAYSQIANFDERDLLNKTGEWLGPERPHPIGHQMTSAVGYSTCGTCHFGSNRTELQYRGYQIDPNRTALAAQNAGALASTELRFTDELDEASNPFGRLHGLAQEQILKFVDWNHDGLDDIPADIHFQAGLDCIDCHTSAEMHNEVRRVKVPDLTDWLDPTQSTDLSGVLLSRQDQATEVECVHCHGNLEYRAAASIQDARNPVRNLIVCPEADEPSQEEPMECANLGRGRWLKSKSSGRWHYVPQTRDTAVDTNVNNEDGEPTFTLNASIFHGRAGPGDGEGPCVNDPLCSATEGFSHLGAAAQHPADEMEGGLECYACHATWQNGCFGCHITLSDEVQSFSKVSGELTLGGITEQDLSYISPLDLQLGINSEGKIAPFLSESNLHFRHVDSSGADAFGASQPYKTYRHRSGYGARTYETSMSGLPPDTSEPGFERDPQMDDNAAGGFNAMVPHTTQRAHPLMNCTNCHLDQNQSNRANIAAKLGAGHFGGISDYLSAISQGGLTRQSGAVVQVDPNAGFRMSATIDPRGYSTDQQMELVVSQSTAFPYAYSNHPMKRLATPGFERAFPRLTPTSGPFNQRLLDLLLQTLTVSDQSIVPPR